MGWEGKKEEEGSGDVLSVSLNSEKGQKRKMSHETTTLVKPMRGTGKIE